MTTYDFDLLTIGGGSGGVAASRRAASYGARVALVEAARVGGTCVLRGCVPKKLLMMGASYANDFVDAAGFGWTVPSPSLDWGALIEAKDRELDRLNHIYLRLLRDSGVTLLEGYGSFVDAHTVRVGERTYTAERILIATGSSPSRPQLPGIEHTLTSNEALDLKTLPRRMMVVGGGYIALEFASIFNAVGVEVTLALRSDTVLRGFDPDIRTHLMTELIRRGIRIETDMRIEGIERTSSGLSVLTEQGDTFEMDHVLYATGRTPAIAGLGLDAAGITTSRTGAIPVNEWSQTVVPHIYAVGDVTEELCLTPVAIAKGRAFADTVYGKQPRVVSLDNAPTAVFSLPPVCVAGLTEPQARARFRDIDVYATGFKAMKNTLSGREERTLMKLVVDRTSQRVLGCHMVGPDAPEIIQGFAVALTCGATKAQFDATVALHPTAAEEFVTLRDRRPDPR